MKIYKWFLTDSSADAERCMHLVNLAFGDELTYLSVGQFAPYVGKSGVPVDRGSEAGTNPGAAYIGNAHDAVVANNCPSLSTLERAELMSYYDLAVELEHNWAWAAP